MLRTRTALNLDFWSDFDAQDARGKPNGEKINMRCTQSKLGLSSLHSMKLLLSCGRKTWTCSPNNTARIDDCTPIPAVLIHLPMHEALSLLMT